MGTSIFIVVFVIGLVIGLVPGIMIGWFIGRSRNKPAAVIPYNFPAPPPEQLPLTVPAQMPPPPPLSNQLSRRCPQCNSTYTDPAIGFCLSDGVQLVSSNDNTSHNSQATLVYRADSSPELLPTVASRPDKP